MRVAFVKAAGLVLLIAAPAFAGSFTTIADTSTAIPNGTGNFTSLLNDPCIDGDTIAFTAAGAGGQSGIYEFAAGQSPSSPTRKHISPAAREILSAFPHIHASAPATSRSSPPALPASKASTARSADRSCAPPTKAPLSPNPAATAAASAASPPARSSAAARSPSRAAAAPPAGSTHSPQPSA